MRRVILAVALFGGATFAGGAQAMTLPAPAGLAAAAAPLNLTDEVRYVCRRVWTGYRWRNRCYWQPNRIYRPPAFIVPRPSYYYWTPYRYRPYQYRTYHRPWRYRHRRW